LETSEYNVDAAGFGLAPWRDQRQPFSLLLPSLATPSTRLCLAPGGASPRDAHVSD